MNSETDTKTTNFIRNIVIQDLESGKHDEIVTRFPPCLLYTSDAADDSALV